LIIGFRNLDEKSGFLVFPRDGLTVLYPVRGFGLNYMACMGSILIWLAFLAIIGITTATFLSFPVASLACLFILFVSLGSGMMKDVFKQVERTVSEAAEKEFDVEKNQVTRITSSISHGLLMILPDYSRGDAIMSLSRGLVVEGRTMIHTLLFLLLLRGGLIFLFGLWYFYRRELGGVV
jgi:hypothetical protein